MSLTARQARLFDLSYDATLSAANSLTRIARRETVTVEEADAILTQLRCAELAMQSLRHVTADQPKTRKG